MHDDDDSSSFIDIPVLAVARSIHCLPLLSSSFPHIKPATTLGPDDPLDAVYWLVVDSKIVLFRVPAVPLCEPIAFPAPLPTGTVVTGIADEFTCSFLMSLHPLRIEQTLKERSRRIKRIKRIKEDKRG